MNDIIGGFLKFQREAFPGALSFSSVWPPARTHTLYSSRAPTVASFPFAQVKACRVTATPVARPYGGE